MDRIIDLPSRKWLGKSLRVGLAGFGLALWIFLVASAAGATAISGAAPSFTAGANGMATGSLLLTNSSTGSVDIKASIGAKPECQVTSDPKTLAPSTVAEVKLTVLAACLASPQQIDVTIGTDQLNLKSAHLDPPATPASWTPMEGFLYGVIPALLAVVLGVCGGASKVDHSEIDEDSRPLHLWRALSLPLTGLDKDWSFQDSWAANLTFVATAATGLFATSDTLTKLLGSSPDGPLGVMAIAGVVAVGLAGAGILITKMSASSSLPTLRVVVLAATVTLTGAIGQLVVVVYEARHIGLPSGLRDWLFPVGGIAIALLVAYGWSATASLVRYHTTAEVAEVSETLVGAAWVAAGARHRSIAPGMIMARARAMDAAMKADPASPSTAAEAAQSVALLSNLGVFQLSSTHLDAAVRAAFPDGSVYAAVPSGAPASAVATALGPESIVQPAPGTAAATLVPRRRRLGRSSAAI